MYDIMTDPGDAADAGIPVFGLTRVLERVLARARYTRQMDPSRRKDVSPILGL